MKTGTLAPGITVLSDGANVVGPGSIHPTGAFYEWCRFQSPDLIPLADPPLWLLDLLRSKGLYTCATGAPATRKRASKRDRPRLLASCALGPSSHGIPGSLDGAAVKSLFGQWWVIEKCLKVLGLEHVRPGVKFRCILHDEENPSAAILSPRDPDDTYAYIDFHHAEGQPFHIPLPLVYYCMMTAPRQRQPRACLNRASSSGPCACSLKLG